MGDLFVFRYLENGKPMVESINGKKDFRKRLKMLENNPNIEKISVDCE